jgi:hypothetical protein
VNCIRRPETIGTGGVEVAGLPARLDVGAATATRAGTAARR